MKHRSIQELYDYWNARRGERAAPERSEIEPGTIRRVLADTFILAFDQQAGHPFRIAGTRACAAFGRELKGSAFVDLWSPKSRGLVQDLAAIVAYESIALVAGVAGSSPDGAELDFELLALPLSDRGRTDTRILGAIAPAELPYWFGTRLITELTLTSWRYLGQPARAPATTPEIANGHSRHGFVVYEGGQP